MTDSDNQNQQTPAENSEQVDLSSLMNLDFGPSWSSGKSSTSVTKERGDKFSKSGPRKGKGGPKRDRRSFSKDHKDFKDNRKPFDKDKPRFEHLPVVAEFYPSDEPFVALTRAMRSSCKTYQLFEIAQLILEKSDRYVVVVKPNPKDKNAPEKFYTCPFDGAAFLTEDDAINYTLKSYKDKFFNIKEVELEAPKGSFPFVNKCGVTGELLAPPNYHRYQQIVQEHFNNNIATMDYERFLSKIESVKDEEQVKAWLGKMTKGYSYSIKEDKPEEEKKAPEAPKAEEAVAQEAEPEAKEDASTDAEQPAEESTPEVDPAPAQDAVEAPVEDSNAFKTWEDARAYILSQKRNEIVRVHNGSVRIPGKILETIPKGTIKRAIEQKLTQQKTFPLDTANNLRGRMRRMNFHIYKRGAKGASYVCSVKRKFREPGSSALSEKLNNVVEFIQKNENCHIKDFAHKYLGIEVPAAKEGEDTPAAELPQEDQARLREVMLDLRWLVSDGYVTEFGDGTLFAPEPLSEKASSESKEETPKEEVKAEEPAPEAKEEEQPAKQEETS